MVAVKPIPECLIKALQAGEVWVVDEVHNPSGDDYVSVSNAYSFKPLIADYTSEQTGNVTKAGTYANLFVGYDCETDCYYLGFEVGCGDAQPWVAPDFRLYDYDYGEGWDINKDKILSRREGEDVRVIEFKLGK